MTRASVVLPLSDRVERRRSGRIVISDGIRCRYWCGRAGDGCLGRAGGPYDTEWGNVPNGGHSFVDGPDDHLFAKF